MSELVEFDRVGVLARAIVGTRALDQKRLRTDIRIVGCHAVIVIQPIDLTERERPYVWKSVSSSIWSYFSHSARCDVNVANNWRVKIKDCEDLEHHLQRYFGVVFPDA